MNRNRYTKAVQNGLVCFLTVLVLVALAIVAGLAGIVAEQRSDDR